MRTKKERFLDKKVNDLTVAETMKYCILVGGVTTGVYAGLMLLGTAAEKVVSIVRQKHFEVGEYVIDWNKEDDKLKE